MEVKNGRKDTVMQRGFYVVLVIKKNVVPLQCKKIARSGAVVARWAHNPKVVGSNPASATKKISPS